MTQTRTLVILRHAKAADPTRTPDVDRPLTPRGHADAAAAGGWLAAHGYAPEAVLCSPARRTRQTWQDVAHAFPAAVPVRYPKRLYGAGLADLLEVIGECDESAWSVLLVGHNPGVTDLAVHLDGGDGELRTRGLRTAGVAVYRWSGSWPDIDAATLQGVHTARVPTSRPRH